MANFRKSLENVYETSQELGLLNVLLSFEDSDLSKIVSIVKKINIGNNETLMTIKSDDEETQPSDKDPSNYEDSSEEDVIIHERFFTGRNEGTSLPGIVIRDHEPKRESIEEIQSENPRGDGKRHMGDSIPRQIPVSNEDNVLYAEKRIKPNQHVTILDLDCTLEPEKIIDSWYSNIIISMIINKEIIKSETNSWCYVLASTRGNARAFLENFDQDVKNALWKDAKSSIGTFIDLVVNQLYKQFTGQTFEVFKSKRSTIDFADALNHLEKISICDMCYFEEYACEYSKYFYLSPFNKWTDLAEKFIRKLPDPFNHEVMEMFDNAIAIQKEKVDPTTNMQIELSLGLAITLTRSLLADKCRENFLVKNSRIAVSKNPRICCGNYTDKIPTQFGCIPQREKQKKKKSFRKKRYVFKRYKKPYKQKFFKKRKFFKKSQGGRKKNFEDKRKFCPQKKKNCRCWLCNESGHYANECPARLGNEERIKLLNTFQQRGFYPVEDPSDTESLYYLTTESESETSESESSEDE